VIEYLADPSASHWEKFKKAYLACLQDRFQADRSLFDDLAKQALETDVHLGCSCPTRKNPDVNHCHTMLALKFMKQTYPDLNVPQIT